MDYKCVQRLIPPSQSTTIQCDMKDKSSFQDTHSTIDSILAETDTSTTFKLTDGSVVRLKYPQFESVVSRIQTYENWSYSSIQQPILLAEAGYFHTGNIIAILKSQEVGLCTLLTININ